MIRSWSSETEPVRCAVPAIRAYKPPSWVGHFDRCRPWIEAALKYAGGTHTTGDVFDRIAAGAFQFWWHPDGCIVTEIIDHPRLRALHHFLAGGSMNAMQDLEPEIEAWAREQGCARITLAGRRGWVRSFLRERGYAPSWTVMSKELSS